MSVKVNLYTHYTFYQNSTGAHVMKYHVQVSIVSTLWYLICESLSKHVHVLYDPVCCIFEVTGFGLVGWLFWV